MFDTCSPACMARCLYCPVLTLRKVFAVSSGTVGMMCDSGQQVAGSLNYDSFYYQNMVYWMIDTVMLGSEVAWVSFHVAMMR